MRERKSMKGIGLGCKLLAGILAAGLLSAPVNACEISNFANLEEYVSDNHATKAVQGGSVVTGIEETVLNDSILNGKVDADGAVYANPSAFSGYYDRQSFRKVGSREVFLGEEVYAQGLLEKNVELGISEKGVELDISPAKPESDATLIAGKRQDWKLENPALDKTEYTMTLTAEQAAGAAKVSYSILIREKSGEFVPVMDQVPVEPDKKGILHLERDPGIMALKTQGELVPWPVTLVESFKKSLVYEARDVKLRSGGYFSPKRPMEDAVDALVTLQTNASGGRVSVKSVTQDVSRYDLIAYEREYVIPTWDAAGNLLPISSWRPGGAAETVLQSMDGDLTFVFAETSEFLEDFYYVVTLEDQAGQKYLTEPVKIAARRGDEVFTVNTEKGKLIYQLYWDHAILLSYSGSDELLEIPGRVKDTPVIEIAPYAFSGARGAGETVAVRDVLLPAGLWKIDSCAFYQCLQLEEVAFPASLESIGDRAFVGCQSLESLEISKRVKSIGAYAFAACTGLKTVKLPGGIRSIGDGAFASCDSLEEILLSGGTSYKVEDGALYAKSDKKLIAVPATFKGSFTVAKGTKVLGKDCFSDSGLTGVILPESLEEIGDYAFYGAKSLKTPMFPDKLKKIGNYAFSVNMGELDFSEAGEKQEEILIGKNLTELGKDAFSGIAAKRFAVAEGNLVFFAKDGVLFARKQAISAKESGTIASGEELLASGEAFPVALSTDKFKVMVIPEGVRELDLTLLDQVALNDRSTDNQPYQIYLPDSVSKFVGNVKCADQVTFLCKEGSKAQEYAKTAGIAISHEMDEVWRECRIKTEKGELTYRLNAKSAVLVRYEGEDEELVIPSLVAGASVIAIGNGQGSLLGHLKKKTLRKLQVPDTVEVFAAHVFENFGDFEVNLPENLKDLGDYAFYGCKTQISELPKSLEKLGMMSLGDGCVFEKGLTIPASLKEIAEGAFCGVAVREFLGEDGVINEAYCVRNGMLYSGDGSVLVAANAKAADGRLTIPDGTKRIGAYAFYGAKFTEIEVSGSVTEIDPYAFAYCSSLKKISFLGELAKIDHHAFVYTGLEMLSLSNGCEEVGHAAFFGSSALKSASGSVREIAPYAFAYCGNLEEVKWEEGLLEIGDHAFYNAKVSQVRLPDSLKKLGDAAFATDDPKARTAVMHEFYIGRDLSEIGENAFACLPISDFVVHEENACFKVMERMLTDRAGKRLIACPAGSSGTVTVPDGIYEIESFAFYRADNVTDIYLADSVGMIGRQAFYDHLGSPEGWKQERAKLHFLSGTAAHAFALEHDWPFALTDKDDDGMM